MRDIYQKWSPLVPLRVAECDYCGAGDSGTGDGGRNGVKRKRNTGARKAAAEAAADSASQQVDVEKVEALDGQYSSSLHALLKFIHSIMFMLVSLAASRHLALDILLSPRISSGF